MLLQGGGREEGERVRVAGREQGAGTRRATAALHTTPRPPASASLPRASTRPYAAQAPLLASALLTARPCGWQATGPDAQLPPCGPAAALRAGTHRTPMRVAKVSMPNCWSPSMSGRSFVMAITVANSVTKAVMKLRGRGKREEAAGGKSQSRSKGAGRGGNQRDNWMR